MSNQKQEFTAVEINIINVLNNLPGTERITFDQLAQRLEITTRYCKDIVTRLREKGYRIVASRKRTDLGIRFAVNQAEWDEYLNKRRKENQFRMAELSKL